jgi:CubicO group peptidase (beta-lactamase class C family)
VVQLVSAGPLRLDDPVADHLPWPGVDPELRRVTVRHPLEVLEHVDGLRFVRPTTLPTPSPGEEVAIEHDETGAPRLRVPGASLRRVDSLSEFADPSRKTQSGPVPGR